MYQYMPVSKLVNAIYFFEMSVLFETGELNTHVCFEMSVLFETGE